MVLVSAIRVKSDANEVCALDAKKNALGDSKGHEEDYKPGLGMHHALMRCYLGTKAYQASSSPFDKFYTCSCAKPDSLLVRILSSINEAGYACEIDQR